MRKTKAYNVSIPWHCTVFVEVEAEDEYLAKEKALKECCWNLCHQCSDRVEIGEVNFDYEPEVYEL